MGRATGNHRYRNVDIRSIVVTDSPASREYSAVAPETSPDFEAVYRDEFSFVYRILRYLGSHEADIEDLAHDVFVVVHGQLATFDASRAIRPWLFGIVHRTLRRHRDKHSRRAAIDTERERDAAPLAKTTDVVLANAQAWHRLENALQELPYEQRVVIVMHDLEEHTAPEIATEMNVALNTIYSRLRLARKRLRTLLVREVGNG